MSSRPDALASAAAQVTAVRDDPAARLALMARVFRGPTGRAPRHLPFRRAALSFMRWQARRGVLEPLAASPPGSRWWRAVNERLLRDGCETVALLGMAGVFLSLRRVLPDRYPLALDVDRYLADEQRVGRLLAYAVIAPRLQCLYEWSAEELLEPRLLGLVRDGNPTYAWPFEERHVWRRPDMPPAARALERLTRARS
jgi:hypothetical protein